jgi:hypothetical protein
MPVDWSRYPADWHTIRARILERSGGRCEWCGLSNGALGYRDRDGRFWTDEELSEAEHLPERDLLTVEDGGTLRRVRIVLTTAHLGMPHPDGRPGDKHDKMDCRDDNLAMLCQRCHLNYDRDEHCQNAAATRRAKRIAAGQGVLWRE